MAYLHPTTLEVVVENHDQGFSCSTLAVGIVSEEGQATKERTEHEVGYRRVHVHCSPAPNHDKFSELFSIWNQVLYDEHPKLEV